MICKGGAPAKRLLQHRKIVNTTEGTVKKTKNGRGSFRKGVRGVKGGGEKCQKKKAARNN